MLVSAPELVACEVTTSGTTGWTAVAGTVELDSAPGMVAIEIVLSNSLLEKLKVVWETIGLVSEGWVTMETVASGSPGDTIRVGTDNLVSVSNWVTHEAVVSS